MLEFLAVVVAATGVWAAVDAYSLEARAARLGYRDAHVAKRSPLMWLVLCLVLWVVAFPCYLVARSAYVRDLREAEDELKRR